MRGYHPQECAKRSLYRTFLDVFRATRWKKRANQKMVRSPGKNRAAHRPPLHLHPLRLVLLLQMVSHFPKLGITCPIEPGGAFPLIEGQADEEDVSLWYGQENYSSYEEYRAGAEAILQK